MWYHHVSMYVTCLVNSIGHSSWQRWVCCVWGGSLHSLLLLPSAAVVSSPNLDKKGSWCLTPMGAYHNDSPETQIYIHKPRPPQTPQRKSCPHPLPSCWPSPTYMSTPFGGFLDIHFTHVFQPLDNMDLGECLQWQNLLYPRHSYRFLASMETWPQAVALSSSLSSPFT